MGRFIHIADSVSAPAPKRQSWWLALGLGLILGATWLYSSILFELAGQWWHDPNFSHGFVVVAFSLVVVWQRRTRLTHLQPKPSWWGLLLLSVALLLLALGRTEKDIFLARLSLLPLIAGLIILLRGWGYFHALLFPWAFLLLMIPLPAGIFHQITLPLQLLAAKVAAVTLPVLGVPVFREGNIINLPAMSLEVVEACSGIRSLLSLLTVAILYGYLMETRVWLRLALALASVPLAILANSLRIVGTGVLVQYWNPAIATGFFHEFAGGLIFLFSLLALILLHVLLRRLTPPRTAVHE